MLQLLTERTIVPDGKRRVDEASPVLLAVVTSLAGVRNNQVVVVLGRGPLLRRALQAGIGADLASHGPADVVVALSAPDVPVAVTMLKPGGRLVALAADRGAAERTAALYGLLLRHTEAVGSRVAWSGQVPA
ncbi:MAG: hypothetical protein JWM02_2533 [Frankiales bacterium]|nr:hypothetical protein [Frankiales bacterium]